MPVVGAVCTIVAVLVGASWLVFAFFVAGGQRKTYPPGPNMNLFRKLRVLLKMVKSGKMPHALHKWHDQYGPVVYLGINLGCLYRGFLYSVSDPDIAQTVLSNSSVFPSRMKGGMTYFIPKSLLGIHENNDMWKKHRSILSKAFTDRYLRQYSEEIISVSNDLVTKIKSNNVIVNINETMADVTYRIVACTVLGKDFFSVYPTVGTKTQLDATLNSVIMVSFLPPPIRGLAKYVSTSFEVANKHWMSKKSQVTSDIKKIREGSMEGNSMLHFLAHHPAGLDTEEIVDELLCFMMAGHETTANALSFSLVCLAHCQSAQEKARGEIFGACGEGELSFATLEKLPYLRAILKESLRLFPVVPLLSRTCTRDTKIGSFDVVPRDDRIIINIYEICRSPEIFANPLKFVPERWEGCELKNFDITHNFGGGLRTCIGKRFAEEESILLLASLLKNFKIELEDHDSNHAELCDIPTISNVTLTFENPMSLRFIPTNSKT